MHTRTYYSTLGPLDVTKSMVEESHKMVAKLHHQLEELHNKFLVQLQNIQEVINMACLNEVERHRVNLITAYSHTIILSNNMTAI